MNSESTSSSAPRLLSFSSFLAELRVRSPVLYWTGAIHFVLGVLLLAAMPFDSGVILGVDRLMKPFKFAVSIGIYAWTFGWFVGYLKSVKLGRILAWIVAVTMLLEIVPITVQPLRGTVSHFNFESALDGAIFAMMGVAIGINTVCAVVLLLGLLFAVKELPGPYLLALRLGMVLFLVGSAVGGALVGNEQHTVGAAEGGPGLPLVNWSTEAGDLRVAHALGLHAMQAVPLFGFLLLVWTRMKDAQVKIAVVLFAVVYGGFTVAAYFQAMAGRPLLG